jgi:hypothetical protein
MEELAIEMGHIIKKMGDESPYGRLGLAVFLPAFVTIMPNQFGATVQTNLFFPFFKVRHLNNLTKNKQREDFYRKNQL